MNYSVISSAAKIIMMLAVFISSIVTIHAAEVSCSTFPSSITNSCNQCFNEGSIRHGQSLNSFSDDFNNNTGNSEIMLYGSWGRFTYIPLQGAGFRDTSDLWEFTPNIVWNRRPTDGMIYTTFPANSTTRFMQFKSGAGILLESVPNATSRSTPVLKIEVDTKTQTFAGGVLDPTVKTHKECAFYTARWCGDAVREDGEECDLGTNNGQNGQTCDSSCKIVPTIGGTFDLSLKKYVNNTTQDAQDGSPFALSANSTFSYIIRVRNEGPQTATGVTTVTDPGPAAGVDIVGTPSGSGWTCTTSGRGFSCTTSAAVTIGNFYPDIIVSATTTAAIGTFRNLATVANPNENPANNFGNNNTDPANVITGPVSSACTPGSTTGTQTTPVTAATPNLCPAGQAVGGFTAVQAPTTGIFTYTWSCNGSAVGGACTANYNPNAVTGIDLSLKKYVNVATQDAQDGSPVSLGTSTAFNYLLQVTNNGTNPVTGTTTVTDPGPATGVNFVGTPTGSGWTCTTSGRAITCTTTATIASGAQFPVITVPATTTTTIGTFRNLATVANPNENPANNFGNNNTDPANVIVTNGGGGGPGTCNNLGFNVVSSANGILAVSMVCAANTSAGSNPTYRIQCGNEQTIDAASGVCQYSLGANAAFPYTAQCYVNGSTQGSPGLAGIVNPGSCRQSIGYAPGAIVPGGGGGNRYCGNGIIDRNDREVRSPTIIPITSAEQWSCTANYTAGTPATATTPAILPVLIDYTCRVNLGEQCDAGSLNGSVIGNSVCSSSCRLNSIDPSGFTNPSANPLTIEFIPKNQSEERKGGPVSKFKWIVGDGISVFDQGDQFRLASPFPTLLQGGTTKIQNISPFLSGSLVSNTFGVGRSCVGNGFINNGVESIPCDTSVPLFTAGENGAINETIFYGNTSKMLPDDPAVDVNTPTSEGSAVLQNNFAISVGYLNEPIFVRVSRPAVTNTAGGNAFAAVQIGYNVNSIAGEFLSDLQTGNFTVTSNSAEISGIVDTTGSVASAATATGTIQAAGLVSTGPISGNVSIQSVDDIRNSSGLGRVGDVTNLYVLKKGNLTISGLGLILDGVGTILIEEGTLDIQTNISYANATASWAFIVKKPNGGETAIQVGADVKNIAGSFLALSGNMDGPVSTQALAVDGNVNANISRLVKNRTFVKANESSSALTTGVTINYSTRAFKNPPPLLTQYIEQYNLAKISR